MATTKTVKKARKKAARKKLLFVDTNIWLDFYRTKTEAGLKLLKHLEGVSDKIIVTYHLEAEFKKNRQVVILEAMNELKPPSSVPRPGIFSDGKSMKVLAKSVKDAKTRVTAFRAKFEKILASPAQHDPVFQACQRIFHKKGPIALARDDSKATAIKNRSLKRFLHGYPPRKKSDTSYGDALSWEWIIQCANDQSADILIVTRDGDYGATFENKSYLNDHLKQEFSERVKGKRKVELYSRLSDALKDLAIAVTPQEVTEEEVLSNRSVVSTDVKIDGDLDKVFQMLVQKLQENRRALEQADIGATGNSGGSSGK